jgi:hypothetical protein
MCRVLFWDAIAGGPAHNNVILRVFPFYTRRKGRKAHVTLHVFRCKIASFRYGDEKGSLLFGRVLGELPILASVTPS